jgi:hypothetical protein
MRNSGNGVSRGIALVASVAGIAGVVVIWSLLDDPGTGYLVLCALPFLIGGVAATGRMATENRILLLWTSAGLAGFVAALTIMSGAGFVLLAGMALYLITAWLMNEGTRRPTS